MCYGMAEWVRCSDKETEQRTGKTVIFLFFRQVSKGQSLEEASSCQCEVWMKEIGEVARCQCQCRQKLYVKHGGGEGGAAVNAEAM